MRALPGGTSRRHRKGGNHAVAVPAVHRDRLRPGFRCEGAVLGRAHHARCLGARVRDATWGWPLVLLVVAVDPLLRAALLLLPGGTKSVSIRGGPRRGRGLVSRPQ